MGLWGLLGYGNLGNDGSLEAVLGYLREHHPEAELEFLCPDPERITARYGIPATRMHWNRGEYRTASGVVAMARKLIGKFVDAFRTAAWVRRFDVVIVPGMGVLEVDDLPLRPWGTPYSLFLMCGWGRLLGTPVALVSVGADLIKLPLSRWLVTSAAGFTRYCSFRDEMSLEAMAAMGVDVSGSRVYPDLAFALPTPPDAPTGRRTVGVGVMSYHGGNGDRDRAEEIYQNYVGALKRFVRWLVDHDHQVRLFIGDLGDQPVVDEILADIGQTRGEAGADRVSAEPMVTLSDLTRQIATVDTVVATRYHNVLCALKAAKPTVSIGYAAKNDVLMAQMGLGDFCQSARSVDFDRLVEQFTALESRRDQLSATIADRNARNRELLAEQFDRLATTVFPGPTDRPERVAGLPGAR